MRRKTIVIVLAVSSCVVTVLATTTTAAPLALSGHVVFTRAGGQYGDETVFVARIDGSQEHRRSTPGNSCCPWATRNGSRVTFGSSTHDGRVTTVVARLDGKHRVALRLPRGTLSLASGPFSPNGKFIAHEGFDDKHPSAAGIYLTRSTNGTIVRRVTRRHFIPGDFSPNGKELLLFTGPDGGPPPPGSLWLVGIDGKHLRRLTPASLKVECCFNFRWSPDGTKILFADAGGIIWTIHPDGSGLTQVYKDSQGRYAATPTWSPDGSMILFALDPTPDPFQHPLNAFYVIQRDGSGLTKVIGGSNFKREPVWVSG